MNDFDEYERDLLRLANDFKNGKLVKPHLRKEAKKLINIQKDVSNNLVKEDTGNFKKGFKTGKVYKYDGNFSIRGYNKSNHAHLINNGHRIVDKNGKEHGFKAGVHYVEKSNEQFKEQYFEDTQKFLDEALEKGLM